MDIINQNERGAIINNYEKTNKGIIKNSGIKEKINQTKTEINSHQIEESQKKNINTKSSSTKAIKSNEAEQYVTMRDYSGKIKYGKENQNTNDYSAVNENKADIVRNGDTVSKVVKSADNADTFKHNSSVVSDVIKGESVSENRTERKTYTSVNIDNSESGSIPARNYNIISENIINNYSSQSTGSTQGYIGNKNTKKLHNPECSKLPSEKNRVLFTLKEEALNQGYTPCGICKP